MLWVINLKGEANVSSEGLQIRMSDAQEDRLVHFDLLQARRHCRANATGVLCNSKLGEFSVRHLRATET